MAVTFVGRYAFHWSHSIAIILSQLPFKLLLSGATSMIVGTIVGVSGI